MAMTRSRLRATVLVTAALTTLGATAAFAEAATSPQINTPSLPVVRAAATHRASPLGSAPDPRVAAPEARVAAAAGGSCSYQSTSIACYDPRYGWWDSDNSCYWSPITPQPPAGDPLWLNLPTSTGTLYNETCETADGLGVGVLGNTVGLSSDPPPGYNGIPATVNKLLALNAVAALGILGPTVRTAPAAGGVGLISLPVWMWSPGTSLLGLSLPVLSWNQISITIGVPSLGLGLPAIGVGLSVLGKKIDWYMGDGHHVTCATLGTAFSAGSGLLTSPTCGYMYTKANKPGEHYTITAVSTWFVTWTIGVATGSLTVVRSTTSTLAIDELQVVNQ